MYFILFYRKAHRYIASLTIVNVNQKFACIILWLLLNLVLHGNNYFSPTLLATLSLPVNEDNWCRRL